jgi:hypothetical protein
MPLACNATYFAPQGERQPFSDARVSAQSARPTVSEAQALIAVRPVTYAFLHYRDRAAAFRRRQTLPREAPGYDDVLFR